MITVKNSDGTQDIYLTGVDHVTTAADAAQSLWASIHQASKIHGGKAMLRTPDDGEWGFLVFWDSGPPQWADAYVVSPEADAPEFTIEAEEGRMVRFTDLS